MPEDVSRFTVDTAAAFGGFIASTFVARALATRFGASTWLSELGAGVAIHLAASRSPTLEPYEEMISVGAAIASLTAVFRRCAPAHIARLTQPMSIGDYSDAHEPVSLSRG